MWQQSYSFSYSILILIGLAFLYLVLPLVLQYLVGEEFYIFSKYQFSVASASAFFFLSLSAMILLLSKKVKITTYLGLSRPSDRLCKLIFLLNFAYLIIVLVRGILLRSNGISREELLNVVSSQLIPGYGYLLLITSLCIIYLKDKWYLAAFLVLAFSIDIVYQGKIFATVGLMITMFYLDNTKYRFSVWRILMLALCGFGFLTLIFVIRSINAEGGTPNDDLVTVYTFFSEFMGVNATAGWGYEYFSLHLPRNLFNFDPVLQKYYLSSVGHGLAISPVGYLFGNFGNYYILAAIVYLICVFGLFYISSKIIGRYVIFVFMYNYIHLLRHGPDIFLYKCVLQIIFLTFVITFIKVITNNKRKLNLTK